MSEREFLEYLDNSKKKVDKAMTEFEKVSKRFDKRVSEILSAL